MLDRVGVLGLFLMLPAFVVASADDHQTGWLITVSSDVVAGGQQRLRVTLGDCPEVVAVRVFSEPSHSLLAAAIDGRFAATLAGKEWLASVESGSPGAPLLTTQLPGADFVVQAHGRPAEDSRISVWMLGTWGNEGQGERLVADALVGAGPFHFSAARGEGEAIEHCCSGFPCPRMCVTCKGPAFTCCLSPCCEISCGHVNCCN